MRKSLNRQLLNLVAARVCGGFITILLVTSLLFLVLYVTPGSFVDRIALFQPQEVKEDVAHYWRVGELLGI
jgi:hypothetical protein